MADKGLSLELSLYPEIEPRLRALREQYGLQCPSEYTFSNLYFFREVHDYRYLPGKYPCIAGTTYDGVRYLMPLFDLRAAGAAELAGLLQGYDCFFPVSAETAAHLDSRHFVQEQFDSDADYFYRASNFQEYRGDLLRKKHNLMQQLLAAHHVEAHPLAPASEKDALDVLRAWMTDKNKAQGEADEYACTDAISLTGYFGLESFVYYADGIAAGLLIAQRLAPGVAAIRFAKGRNAFKGIYQYMFHHYCESHRGDIEWINFEQDLGLPNFRQTKRSYQPDSMVQKFRIRVTKCLSQ